MLRISRARNWMARGRHKWSGRPLSLIRTSKYRSCPLFEALYLWNLRQFRQGYPQLIFPAGESPHGTAKAVLELDRVSTVGSRTKNMLGFRIWRIVGRDFSDVPKSVPIKKKSAPFADAEFQWRSMRDRDAVEAGTIPFSLSRCNISAGFPDPRAKFGFWIVFWIFI